MCQVLPSHQLKASRIQTQIYPGIPTDLQSVFGVLATQAAGSSLVFDTMFEGRLKYIDELNKMGLMLLLLTLIERSSMVLRPYTDRPLILLISEAVQL